MLPVNEGFLTLGRVSIHQEAHRLRVGKVHSQSLAGVAGERSANSDFLKN